MARLWTIAILAFVAGVTGFTQAGGDKTKDKDFQVQGKFTKDDPRDQQRGGPSQTHTVRMKAGKAYTIDMVSTEVDSYLRLLDSKGTQLEEDDDSGGNLNSRIIFNCSKDGEYKLVCTTFGAATGGSYTLTVKTNGSYQPPATAHALLIGSPAPDFKGDFAINGQPSKLSDLEGKVVLLNFWDVRSSLSVALLPRLKEWNKAYKTQGLAIVGVTFYPSDIDQQLGFNEESGRVITVGKADRKTDQALLTAVAAYHKADHLLMALNKQDALDTFNIYAVNNVPQVVLIDRKGIIRFIDVSSAKNSSVVEIEIKKLLAEK